MFLNGTKFHMSFFVHNTNIVLCFVVNEKLMKLITGGARRWKRSEGLLVVLLASREAVMMLS